MLSYYLISILDQDVVKPLELKFFIIAALKWHVLTLIKKSIF